MRVMTPLVHVTVHHTTVEVRVFAVHCIPVSRAGLFHS